MIKQLLINIFAFMAYYLGLCRLFFKLASFRKDKKILAVFTFHRVAGLEKSQKYYKEYEQGQNQKIFENEIKTIGKYFKVIGLDEFLEILNGNKKLKTHSALLTFDDADSDFINNAYPILRKYNYESVNFAPTDYIDSEKRFWHLRLSNLVYNANPGSWAKLLECFPDMPQGIKSLIQSLSQANEKQMPVICRNIAVEFDKIDQDKIDTILDEWEKMTSIKYTLGIKCMGWDELRFLDSNSAKIESHTVTHRKLNTLDSKSILKELVDSKIKLESELNRKVRTLCYPVGAVNDDVIKEMARTEYEAGFLTEQGICDYPTRGIDKFKIKRLNIYGDNKYKIDMFLGKIAMKCVFQSAQKNQ